MIRSVVVAGLLLAPATLHAQNCFGNPSFRDGSAIVRGGVGFGDGEQDFGVGMSFGSSPGVFGGFDGGVIKLDGVDDLAPNVGAHVGGSVPSGNVELCPFLSFGYVWFPEILGVSPTGRTIAGGFAVGGEIRSSPTLSFLPFGAIEYGQTTISAEGESFSDTSGLLVAGGGLLFNRSLSVTPAVVFPLGVEGAEASFRIGVSLLTSRRR